MPASDSSFVRRLLSGVGANVFGQVVTIAIQLLSVPVFLHLWGARMYGEWLILAAMPSYFSMADVGMVAVAMNKMTMLNARGEKAAANAVFQSVLVLTIVAALTIGAIAAVVVGVVDIGPLRSVTQKAVFFILVCGALTTVFGGLFEAVLVSSNRYAESGFCASGIRLFEWLGGLAAITAGGTFLAVASGMVGCRVAASVAMFLSVRRRYPAFTWGFAYASMPELRSLVAPALSFMAYPLSNALNIQGFTLLVGNLFGPVVLATFNTYRTLSRIIVQVVGVFALAFWPEFARAYGAHQMHRLSTLFFRGNNGAVVVNLAAAVTLWTTAPWLLSVWTGSKIAFDPEVFKYFLLCTVAAGLAHIPRVLLMATNRHLVFCMIYLFLSLLVIPVAWVLSKSLGLTGAVLGSFGLESATMVAAFFLAFQMIRSSYNERKVAIS